MTIPEAGPDGGLPAHTTETTPPWRNRIAAVVCLSGSLILGGFGISKTIDERHELHYLYEIRDINQKGIEDIRKTAVGYESTIVGLEAENIEASMQSSIDDNQKSIDQHRVQEWIGICLIAGGAALLAVGIFLLRKWRMKSPSSAEEPAPENICAESDAATPVAPEEVTAKAADRDYGPFIAVGAGLGLLVLIVSLVVVSNGTASDSNANLSSIPAGPAPAALVSAPANTQDAPARRGEWQLSSATNAVTGEVTTAAALHSDVNESQYIVVRMVGKKLECYVNTDEFLETVDNLESHLSTVQYKFDDGKVIRQGWTLSSDNEALFYPGNCAAFVALLRKSKTLALEFRPSEKIPETVTFDVEGFPEGFKVGN